MSKRTQNMKPFDAAEKAAIIKDYESGGYCIVDLVRKYHRGQLRINAICKGRKRQTLTKDSKRYLPVHDLQTINEALASSNKDTGVHSALFKQIFTLVKQQAPEVHRVSLDIETRQVTFETLSSHKVTL